MISLKMTEFNVTSWKYNINKQAEIDASHAIIPTECHKYNSIKILKLAIVLVEVNKLYNVHLFALPT